MQDQLLVSTIERRQVLRGIASVGVLSGLAGCMGNGGGNGASPVSGSEYPAVEEWLTETSIGGADDTYDGTIVDRRGEQAISIDVGAPGNGNGYAFGPSAVTIDAGTTVQWVWTGEGELHNVEAEPEDQIGESDYEFSSGDPVSEEGHEYSFQFDTPGIALYHCEPHLALGMKGAIVIE